MHVHGLTETHVQAGRNARAFRIPAHAHQQTQVSQPPQTNQRGTSRSWRDKEAGPRRGGERGPAYGPALGGEAGAVLIGSLSAKGPWGEHWCRIDHRCRITIGTVMRLQPIELQHMPPGLRRVYDEIATV
jgi:hypothetical protein